MMKESKPQRFWPMILESGIVMIRNKTYNRRSILFVVVIIGIVIGCLMGRLSYLMIFKSEYYGERAREIHERERPIKAPRGAPIIIIAVYPKDLEIFIPFLKKNVGAQLTKVYIKVFIAISTTHPTIVLEIIFLLNKSENFPSFLFCTFFSTLGWDIGFPDSSSAAL